MNHRGTETQRSHREDRSEYWFRLLGEANRIKRVVSEHARSLVPSVPSLCLCVSVVLFFLEILAGSAHAVEPSEMLKDPALEARARAISRELRCLVCQNQSIDDSAADLAHDLRVIVRERLTAGDSDDQVKAYLVARYGDYVLLDPPFKATTLLLWLGPAALMLLGVGGVYLVLRRRLPEAPPPLDDAERRRLARLMDQPPDGRG